MTRLMPLVTGAILAIGMPSWTAQMQPFRVVGDLYDVGSQGISAFLLKTKYGLVLIDAGMPSYAPQLIRNIEALGFKPTDVKIILASHAHFDHAGGLAKLAVMAEDVKADETGTYPGSEIHHELDFPPVKVDRVLHDGDTVSLGGETLTAHLTPGHTAGCTTWTFPVTEVGKTYSVLYQCSMSVAANRLVDRPQYPGIVADYRKTFATLKAMKADVFLAPHAEQFGLVEKKARIAPDSPNPFIDPTEFQRRVAAGEAAFNTDLANQQAAAAKAKP
jgi:metallo-beta-lactamase class B